MSRCLCTCDCGSLQALVGEGGGGQPSPLGQFCVEATPDTLYTSSNLQQKRQKRKGMANQRRKKEAPATPKDSPVVLAEAAFA